MKKMDEKKGSVVFFLLLMFLNLCICYQSNNNSELELLESIKESFRDPLKSLSSWDSSSLHFCQWSGISCDNSSSHVVKIELSGKNLSGKITDEIFRFPYLEDIDLSDNQLFGELIPAGGNLSSCLSLKHLNLSNNNFTGPIPRASNPGLETFDLSNNMLSGNIPEEIGLFSSLRVLDFGGNVLEGKIPMSITNVTSLEFLTLSSNQLVGEIPPGIGLMKKLRWIYLGYNNLSGEIPKELGELTSLQHLNLVYNNLTGEIPTSFGNLTSLEYLFIYVNKLTGPIPGSLFNLEKLLSLDLSGNYLSGDIPESILKLKNLEVLHLFSNNFSGRIPKALSSLPNLQVLQLWSNKFHGEIPGDLGRYNNLTILDLSTNNLTGKIPESLCASGGLFKLILFSNSIGGGIPESLARCKSLRRIRLQNNNLTGELPQGFTQLPLVYFLDISGNDLFGTIGKHKYYWDMPELQMLSLARNKFSGELPDSFGSKKIENLDLSGNYFSGGIPPTIGELPELVELNLNRNNLSGKIPDEICLCKKLVTLDLSCNQLNGEIPSSLSDLPVLGQLDLSRNQLSGEIPQKLGTVGSLVQVNISYNHLHGSLPLTGAFLAINSSAVTGNDLCGHGGRSGETGGDLPPCKRSKNPAWWFLLTCLLPILLAFALTGFIIIIIVVFRGKKESNDDNDEDGTWELRFLNSKFSPKSVTINDVLSSPKEENLIGRGRNGASYQGSSRIGHTRFVAKVLSDVNSFPMTTSSWWTEVEKLGRINHPNIVQIIAACKSVGKGGGRGGGGGILVYEYIEGKDLNKVLRNLTWNRRKRVAIGIARALGYLHSICSPSVYVGDLSPRKVIVDFKDEAHLRLTLPDKLVCEDKKCFISSAYPAPETTESKVKITEKSDIYSLGLILIELLTGRNPSEAAGHELFGGGSGGGGGGHESYVEWARYCYSDCHLDVWVDPMMIKMNPTLKNNYQRNEIVETMNLALKCTADDPKARPSAIDVAKMLARLTTTTCGCS